LSDISTRPNKPEQASKAINHETSATLRGMPVVVQLGLHRDAPSAPILAELGECLFCFETLCTSRRILANHALSRSPRLGELRRATPTSTAVRCPCSSAPPKARGARLLHLSVSGVPAPRSLAVFGLLFITFNQHNRIPAQRPLMGLFSASLGPMEDGAWTLSTFSSSVQFRPPVSRRYNTDGLEPFFLKTPAPHPPPRPESGSESCPPKFVEREGAGRREMH